MSAIDTALAEVIEKLKASAPEAWDRSVVVVRADAIAFLASVAVLTVIAAIVSAWSLPIGLAEIAAFPKDSLGQPCIGCMSAYAVLGVVAFILAGGGIGTLVGSPWAWISAFKPELGLAKRVLDKVA